MRKKIYQIRDYLKFNCIFAVKFASTKVHVASKTTYYLYNVNKGIVTPTSCKLHETVWRLLGEAMPSFCNSIFFNPKFN